MSRSRRRRRRSMWRRGGLGCAMSRPSSFSSPLRSWVGGAIAISPGAPAAARFPWWRPTRRPRRCRRPISRRPRPRASRKPSTTRSPPAAPPSSRRSCSRSPRRPPPRRPRPPAPRRRARPPRAVLRPATAAPSVPAVPAPPPAAGSTTTGSTTTGNSTGTLTETSPAGRIHDLDHRAGYDGAGHHGPNDGHPDRDDGAQRPRRD